MVQLFFYNFCSCGQEPAGQVEIPWQQGLLPSKDWHIWNLGHRHKEGVQFAVKVDELKAKDAKKNNSQVLKTVECRRLATFIIDDPWALVEDGNDLDQYLISSM